MFDIDTNSVAPDTDDLDAFDSMFHGHETKVEDTKEPASSEEEVVEDDADANETTEDDTLASDDDADEAEDEGEDDESAPDPEPKPKKNRVQERIDELTREKHEERRERLALQAKLDEILANMTPKTVEAPAEKAERTGPDPDELNEDGTEKYPLGEYDPTYIRDLARHTFAEEIKASKIAQEEQARLEEEQKAQVELATEWNSKLETAKERYPDLQEKNVQLVESFGDLDPAYGEYLAATIMSMDNGPDVLYHLATNLDEARQIVASGPTRATLALGRLEARYQLQNQEQKERKLKVSSAPTPPPQINKGAVSVSTIAPDTDDLDAFETLLFQKRR